jgi:CHAT domain-containing protein
VSKKHLVLAEYFTTEEQTFLFGMRADFMEPEVVTLPLDRTELRRFVRANFGERNRVREFIEMGLQELWHGYDYLVEPITRWAAPEDIVYLVPHDLLHYLPLHALKLAGQYLIDRNPVVYSPSASVLKYCYGKRKHNPDGSPARRTAAIFGDSRGDLPYARVEAQMLAELFGVTPLLGTAVTLNTLRQAIADVDIVHFAGHGDFHADQPLESGLCLAGEEILTAREIFGLRDLHSHLVTLSGCETGINENHPGDELIGLTRSVLYAGSPSVLVSLWRVADDSTAFLMKQFYTYLCEDPSLYKVDALRKAMLETKAQPQWASFYCWAPFVLVGDYQ